MAQDIGYTGVHSDDGEDDDVDADDQVRGSCVVCGRVSKPDRKNLKPKGHKFGPHTCHDS